MRARAQLHRFLGQAGYVVVGPTFPAGFEYDQLTQDVSFVITEMLARSAGSQAPLAGLINDRIGFIGTSKGGMIGLALYQAVLHRSAGSMRSSRRSAWPRVARTTGRQGRRC